MVLRFLILSTDYPEFLGWLYAQHPGLDKRPYDEQMQVRYDSLFGDADFYSRNLRLLGHEAFDIYANNEFMQRAWAREHGIQTKSIPSWMHRSILKPLFHRLLQSRLNGQSWFHEILAAQIRCYSPDILLNQAMGSIRSPFLKAIKPSVRLLVGQIASPLPEGEDFGCYDLIISSLPNLVQYFSRMGRPAELNLLGFEPRILSRLSKKEKRIPVSFVGSLFPQHKSRIDLLEYLCRRADVQIWGNMAAELQTDSSILRNYKGQAWGLQMYQVLHDSKMTLNHHIDIAETYANNLRLFEATGVGAMLITDWKVNLHEMFELGKEVVAYRSPEECLGLVKYYLEHDDEREAIARAGHERTLREHTYKHRMREFLDIIGKYL